MIRLTNVRQTLVRYRVAAIALTSLALASAFVVTILVAAGTALTAEQQAIQNVCLHAVLADQTLEVPLLPGVTHSTAQSVETTSTAPLTASQVTQLKARVPQVYGQYYQGDLLRQRVTTMQGAIDRYNSTEVRYFGGGVDWMRFSKVNITGNSASVTASAMIWAKKAQVQDHGKLVYATPHNQLNYTFTLTKANGAWRISAESWDFAPGSEP